MSNILSAKEAFDMSTIDRNEEVQKEFEKVMISIGKATQKGAYDLRVYHLQEENQQKLRDLGFTVTEKKPSTKSFTFYEIEWDKPDDPFFDGDEPENPDDPNNPDNPDDPSGGGGTVDKDDIDNLFPDDKNNSEVTP